MRNLIIPVIGFFAWQALRASRAASRLEFYPKNIKIEGKKIKDLKLFFVLDIVNPTQKTLSVKAVFAKIFSNGEQVGRIEFTNPTEIKGLQTITLEVPIILTPDGAGLLIANLLQGKKNNFQIDGLVTSSSGIQFPFNFNISK